LLGQGTLRTAVAGEHDRPLSPGELRQVLRSVEEGMDDGAFGLSTGLEYAPGRFTPAEEIEAMAHIVAKRGGLYASHIRNEEARLLPAIEEALEIGRATGVRTEISHLKAAGKPNWHKQEDAIARIEAARCAGVDVLADAYPYTAYSTSLTIFLPDWALDGGWDALAARLENPLERAKLRTEVEPRVQSDPGGYELVVISNVGSAASAAAVGQTLLSLAESWRVEPAEAALRLLEAEKGQVSFVGHGMDAANVERVLAHPLVMIGSDGVSRAVPRPGEQTTQPHPRSYGTCARILGYYTRERGLFDLPTAVAKMTSMPAGQIGLRDRGRIAVGQKADVVVFNAHTVADKATFADPHQFPVGIPWVLVNGIPVIADGVHTGARPGRALRRA
jgi:N-acyl-D-amino-acid deacylase